MADLGLGLLVNYELRITNYEPRRGDRIIENPEGVTGL